MIQQIPYDAVKAKNLNENTQMRYPYQVIYDNKGICSEKSMLLAALLSKLGYGVALFHFVPENHMSVGIKSPMQYSYVQSGYAFIETTNPSIPTDAIGTYSDIGQLTSVPIIYMVSDGKSMNGISQEYNDGIRYQQLSAMGNVLPANYYYEWKNLSTKYGLVYE
jgi:hypothetical protein